MMGNNNKNNLGKILKQRRVMILLTLKELSYAAGVSSSYLGRIERGERFPSAHVLHRIAKPLDFEESELFTLANYLSPQPSASETNTENVTAGLDPLVASVLAQKPVDVQRVVIGILSILEGIARRDSCLAECYISNNK